MRSNSISDWVDLLSGGDPGVEIELPVLSGSMYPVLPPGSSVIIRTIKPEQADSLFSGSIVIFRKNHSLNAHRIIYNSRMFEYVYEKGDCNRFGSFIPYEDIRGVVICRKDDDGTIRDFLNRKEKRKAGIIALKNLVSVFYNCLMIIPRRIKSVPDQE